MGKFRGCLVKQRIRTVFRCLSGRQRSPISYHLLNSPSPVKPISRFFRWTRKLRSKVKAICCVTSSRITGREYMDIGHDLVVQNDQLPPVPKGYMPVYVGQKDGDFERVLVPVIYFNDPLFGQLLREAEEEFGFHHPGAITIPCRISEFEHVQTRIKEGRGTRKILWRK